MVWNKIEYDLIKSPTIPQGRSSTSIAIIHNKLYLFSGENVPRVPIDNNLYYLDLQTNVWNLVSQDENEWPEARIGHACAVSDNKIWIYGGRRSYKHAEGSTLNDFWSYDPEKNLWTKINGEGQVPEGLSYHSMTSIKDNVFIFGGCKSEGRSNQLWQYNVTSNQWTELSSLSSSFPSQRGGCSFVGIEKSNELHVLFGFDGKVELQDHYKFDLNKNEWKEVESSIRPTSRSVTDVVYLPSLGKEGSLFVFGGETTPSTQGHEGAGLYLNDSWIYDIESNVWRSDQSNSKDPIARGWFSSCSLSDGLSVLIFGGFDGTSRLNDSYIWTFDGLHN